MWPNWGMGCGGGGAPRALTLLTGVTRHGVTYWVEKLELDALTLLTGVTRHGVTCWVEKHGVGVAPGARCGPGSTLPESMLLLLPVLKCGCVKRAGGVVGRYLVSCGETCPLVAWCWVWQAL